MAAMNTVYRAFHGLFVYFHYDGRRGHCLFTLSNGSSFVYLPDSTSFAGVSWRAADTLDRVIGAGAVRPIVVVAPYNTGARIDEYTPVKDPGYRISNMGVSPFHIGRTEHAKMAITKIRPHEFNSPFIRARCLCNAYAHPRYGGGRGDDYLDWLRDTLVPLASRSLRIGTQRAQLGYTEGFRTMAGAKHKSIATETAVAECIFTDPFILPPLLFFTETTKQKRHFHFQHGSRKTKI